MRASICGLLRHRSDFYGHPSVVLRVPRDVPKPEHLPLRGDNSIAKLAHNSLVSRKVSPIGPFRKGDRTLRLTRMATLDRSPIGSARRQSRPGADQATPSPGSRYGEKRVGEGGVENLLSSLANHGPILENYGPSEINALAVYDAYDARSG